MSDAHTFPCPLAHPASTHLPERCTCAEVRMAERRLAHVGDGCWCAGPCPETLRQLDEHATRHASSAMADAAASRVVSNAFDMVRAEAERHGFDADWIEGLENLREAVARTLGVR